MVSSYPCEHLNRAGVETARRADGIGLSSRAGTVLLALAAQRLGLTDGLSGALEGTRERRSGHDPGRVLCDLAVMAADGGRCVSDLQALAGQPALFGEIARASPEASSHRRPLAISDTAARHGTTTRQILMTTYPLPSPRRFTDRVGSSEEHSEAVVRPGALPWLAGEDLLNAIVWDQETLDKFHRYFPPKDPVGPPT